MQALINAEKRGVKVRGITDKTLEGKSYYTDTHLIAENLKKGYKITKETSSQKLKTFTLKKNDEIVICVVQFRDLSTMCWKP